MEHLNHKARNISLSLCGMMPLQIHFCRKSVRSDQHPPPPINSLHVRPCCHYAIGLFICSTNQWTFSPRFSQSTVLGKLVLNLFNITSIIWHRNFSTQLLFCALCFLVFGTIQELHNCGIFTVVRDDRQIWLLFH